MAVLRKHERELVNFLRREYGADHCRIEGGGKHTKLKFRCHGSEYSYIVGASGDYHAIRNTHAELKRILSAPPDKPDEEEPTMQTKTIIVNPITLESPPVVTEVAPQEVESPPIPHVAARTWTVRVAAYKGQSTAGPMVWFIFPVDASEYIKQTYQRVTIQKLDKEHWQITKGGNRKFVKYGKKVKLTYTDPEIEPFGSSPAEAVEANGEILIYLAKENRVPIAQLTRYPKPVPPPQMKKPEPKPVPPIRLKADPAPAETPPPVQHAKVTMQQPMLMTTSTLMEQRMYDIIRQVYDIQELCPYRLVILADGRLVWRAPEIG